MIKNVIVISDLHCGCRLGLCPPEVQLDDGGIYQSSDAQKMVYDFWLYFWNTWVKQVTKGEDYAIVLNGDAIDGNHHNSTTQISHNITDQVRIAQAVLSPILRDKKCKAYYHIRGTEAHVGISGQNEEILAESLGAIPNEQGQYARWELYLKIGGHKKLCHFSHHVGSTSSSAYESTAPFRESVEMLVESGRWGHNPPDAIIRSHRHRAIEIRKPSQNGYNIVLVTPGWQMKTPYVYKLIAGRVGMPEIGGYLLREGDEDGLYSRFKVMKLNRSKEEEL